MVDEGGVTGLAGIPPGPALAAALDRLTPTHVSNGEVVELLIAHHRQLAHQQAQLWATTDEVLHRHPFAQPWELRRGTIPELDGADEVRAALTWTRRAAERETHLAHTIVCHLPLVWQALDAAVIDRGKAVVFARHLPDLAPDQIARICQVLLPIAARLTTGQLDERLKRLLIEIDPGYYTARYHHALTHRRVTHHLDENGAAVITATGLPADEAAAALARVDHLARTAGRTGHPATLDQIRADVVLAMLDGSLHGLTRDQIIDALITRHAGGLDDEDPDGPDTGPHDSTDDTGPTDTGPTDTGPTDTGPTDTGPTDTGPTDTGPTDTGPTDTGNEDPGRDDPNGDDPNGDDSGSDGRVGEGRVGDARVGIEIRAPLTALLGESDRAGHLPGLGPITAATTRRAVARAHRASWRWAVCDPQGRLLTEGLTRHRPTTHGTSSPTSRPPGGPAGGIVELQITDTDLTRLAAQPAAAGPWARVIADIAHQHHQADSDPGPAGLVDLDAHPDDRFPRAALRRHIQIRDRTCCHPGCRAPATRTDLDHTRDHAHGGPTTRADLGPACRHDHQLKTTGGWTLHQPQPGIFDWTSPLGRRYRVRPEPILPPPIPELPRPHEPWFTQPPTAARDLPLITPQAPKRAPPAEPPPPPLPRGDPFGLLSDGADGNNNDGDDPPPF